MNKGLRLGIICIMVILLCLGTANVVLAATNIPTATSDFYVNDFANVFTQEQNKQLMTNAVNLANEHNGIQVVVTTVKSLEGASIEEYAYKMYNQYGIGKEDMGLLILLATEDRQIRVEVGRGMEGYINDAKAGRFIDEYAIPYLRENKFDRGLINLQQALISEINSCVSNGTSIKDNSGIDINIDWGVVLLVILGIAVTGGVVWCVAFIVTRVKRKQEEKKQYIEGLNLEIKNLNLEIKNRNSQIGRLQTITEELRQDRNNAHNKLESTTNTLASLQNRYKRILMVYPDADIKVDEMIKAEKIAKDKAAARNVDALIASVINLKPDKDLVSKIQAIKYQIESLSADEAKYLKSDLSKLNDQYRKCLALKKEYDEQVERERRQRLTESRRQKAAEITTKLLGIISMVGVVRASDLSRLRSAKHLYEGLDSETRGYIEPSAISKIEELLRRAKRAKEEEEAEERRRRQAMHSSTTTYRSSYTIHRGFGGRSGGGGASRRF